MVKFYQRYFPSFPYLLLGLGVWLLSRLSLCPYLDWKRCALGSLITRVASSPARGSAADVWAAAGSPKSQRPANYHEGRYLFRYGSYLLIISNKVMNHNELY